MKLELEIDDNQLSEQINKAVKEYLDDGGLLRFIREETIRIFRSSGRELLSERIRILNIRVAKVERILEKIGDKDGKTRNY